MDELLQERVPLVDAKTRMLTLHTRATRCVCKTAQCAAAAACCVVLLIAATISALVGSQMFSFSQDRQDAFVVALLRGMTGGLFVDVGASDGITNSNSMLLESMYGYRGICIEPGPRRYLLWLLRPRCSVSFAPIGSTDGKEVVYVTGERTAEHSHVAAHGELHSHSSRTARTATLERLIAEWQSARGWDTHQSLNFTLVSIDVEGFESEVLKGFPFAQHSMKVLFVEDSHSQAARIKEHIHQVSELLYIGNHGADMIFTEGSLAKRAREMLDASPHSKLGAWKRVKGLYFEWERAWRRIASWCGVDMEAMLRRWGLRRC